MLYYIVDQEYNAKGDALWFYVDQDFQATCKIFWVNQDYQADVKVCKIDQEYRAKWNSNNKFQSRIG